MTVIGLEAPEERPDSNVRFCLNTAHSFTPKVELKFLPYLNLAYWQHYLSGLRTIQGQGRDAVKALLIAFEITETA